MARSNRESKRVNGQQLVKRAILSLEHLRRFKVALMTCLVEGQTVSLSGIGTFEPWRGKREGAARLSAGDHDRIIYDVAGVRFRPARRLRYLVRLGSHGVGRGVVPPLRGRRRSSMKPTGDER